MQTSLEKERNARWLFVFGRIIFTMFLLIAVDEMRRALVGSGNWILRFEVFAPWWFIGMAGASIWASAARKKMDRETASGLLMMLGFAVQYSYEVLGKFIGNR